ncbi:GAF domain-containing sensor histidine kinase [Lysinibacillus antri]|uniref:GAF domain-containing sensor histidine kinase n=1 Tax=Lysinibacillus antri TaxID=2498145 RepID=UPI001319C37E|nr:GAF domain-containing sensor histidine kinase [Lysinibacillus antri]
MINTIEFQVKEVKPLNKCYFIVDRETLQIRESNICNCAIYQLLKTIYASTQDNIEQADPYATFHPLLKRIINEIDYNMGTASSFEIQFNNQSTIEVKVYLTSENFIILLKDNTKHVQVFDIIEENNQRLTILTEISKEIMQFNEPKKILDSLFERLSSLLDVDFYFNYILDSSNNQIKLMNYHGISKEIAESIEILQFGEAVCGTVAKTQKKIIAEHVDKSDDPKVQLIKGWNIKAYICHPLFAHGKLIGTLSFGSSKRSTFSTDEVELICDICKQVATSLERVFLIANLKETNKALVATNQQLLIEKERADKANKAKTNFLLLMSHELRTPLNSIIGYNELLLTTPNSYLSNNQIKQLEKMLRASNQLKNMINDMLDFVRYDNVSLTFNLRKVDINALIEDCILDAAFFAKSKRVSVDFEVLMNNTDLYIYSDLKRLKQVVTNLLTNAIKYNKDNGNVRISTNVKESILTIEFHDTGKGIEEKELEDIFKPFYRSPSNNPTVEGSGIGLSLSKQIIHELGGSLTVSSKVNVGSTFKITLPLNLY